MLFFFYFKLVDGDDKEKEQGRQEVNGIRGVGLCLSVVKSKVCREYL